MNLDPGEGREDELLPWLLAYDRALSAGLSPQQARDSTIETSIFEGSEIPVVECQLSTPQHMLQGYCTLLDSLEAVWPRHRKNPLDPSDAEETPLQIGRFRIIQELGRGGFGIVYLAFDPKLGRRVALKLPRSEVLFTSSLRNRFLREAQATAALDHPHIAPLFETGEIGEVCYLVSPYCAGGTVADYVAKQAESLPVRQAAQLVLRLAEAVHYAHSRGVLHRDIKPANVLLDMRPYSDPREVAELPFIPRLTDFGLARFLELDDSDGIHLDPDRRFQRASTATCTGALLGTPRYMAPEQVEGQPTSIGSATDVYGLGALLYELLAGEPPFSGGSKADALRRVLLEPPIPLRRLRNETPADLEAICLKCLEKHPGRRYASAEALRADLDRFLSGTPTLARPLNLRQQTVQWIRREPARASLVGTIAATLLGTIIGLSAHNMRLGAYADALQSSLDRELAQTQLANEQRSLAEQRELDARGHNYVSDVWRAQRMWNEGECYRICDLLRRSAPQTGQSDLREFTWRYLWALGSNLSDLPGHVGYVHGVKFSPNGQMLASWSRDSADHSIRLWNVHNRSGRLAVRTTGEPRAVAFSADGQQFTSVDSQGHVCRWDASTGQKLDSHFEQELQDQDAQPYPQIAFLQDARLLAYSTVSAPEWELRVLDLATDELRTILGPSPHPVRALASSRDSSMLAVAWDGIVPGQGLVQLISMPTGEVLKALPEKEHGIHDLEFSPNGEVIAVGTTSTPAKLRLWTHATGQLETIHAGSSSASISVGFSPNGEFIASARDEGPVIPTATDVVQVWNTKSGDVAAEPATSGETILSLKYSPNGQLLAFGGSNGLLRLWSRGTHEAAHSIPAHDIEAWGVAFSPDSSLVVSTSDDHTCKVWDARTGAVKASLVGHESLATAVAFAPDGETLATCSFDACIKIWDAANGQQQRTLEGHKEPIRGLAFRSDGNLLASIADDCTIKLWDPKTGALQATIEEHRTKIRAVVFRPASDLLISSDNAGFVKLWDTKRHVLVKSWQQSGGVHSLAITRDGSLLAAGSKEGPIRLYHMPSGELSLVLSGPAHGVRSLAFSPDGRTLASGGEDAAVTLWHVTTGQELLTLPGVNAQVNGLAFAPDGQTLAAATHDGALTLWRASRDE